MATYEQFSTGPNADALKSFQGAVNKYVVLYDGLIAGTRVVLNTYASARQAATACRTVLGSNPLCVLLVAGVAGYTFYKVLHNGHVVDGH